MRSWMAKAGWLISCKNEKNRVLLPKENIEKVINCFSIGRIKKIGGIDVCVYLRVKKERLDIGKVAPTYNKE